MTDLVLLPGLDGTATMHADFLSACTAFESAVAITYPTDQLLDYAELEQWVRAQLPSDRPFVLLGESFSGPVALAIANKPPANLVGLVLCASFCQSPLPYLARLTPALSLLPVHHAPGRLLSWWLFGPWANRQLEQSLQAALRSVSTDVLRFRARTALRLNHCDCSRIRVPTLYLRAENDRLMPRTAATLVVRNIPHCRIIDLPGPHLLLQTNPLQSAEAVCAFLQNLPT